MRKIFVFAAAVLLFSGQHAVFATEASRWEVDFKRISEEGQTIIIKNTGSKVHAVKAEVKGYEANGTEISLAPYIMRKNVKSNEALSFKNVDNVSELIVTITWRDKLMKVKARGLASGEKKTFILEKRGSKINIQ
ncbi:hypothetical protein [Bacillus sp. Marseille-Q1617]|uniref:hypothetical protein n=1 Tax=Bacillus sp. Marseille-Q1617 TaxID=2736887 RepID=UPI0015895B52|nr:hypothetical protein [Bacillus sp. Marseille-Q1617]